MFSKFLHPARRVFVMSAAVSLLFGGLGRTAAAKECTTDADCDTWYQCVLGYAAGGTNSTGGGAVSSTPGTAGVAPVGGAMSIGTGAATGSASDGTGGAGGSVANPGAGAASGTTCPAGSNCVTTASPPTRTPSVPATDAGAALPASPDAASLPPTPVPMPEPVPTPTTGICEPKPIVCTSVADCPSADFDCVMDLIPTIAPTCAANTKCEAPPPQASTTGTCVAKPHACSTAADCPAPLTCQAEYSSCSGGASVGPDGTVTTTGDTCTPGPSVCTFVPVTCATDTDCADPLYQCVKVSESNWCTASGVVCAVGGTCPPPPLPTCGTTVVMNCLPKLIDCACGPCPAGATCGACATCPAGWNCFDFANVGGVPSTWGSIASSQACLPDGIILAAQGHAAGGGQFATNSGSSGTSSGPVGLGVATGAGGSSGTSSDASTKVASGQPGGTTPPVVRPVAPRQGGANAAADGGVALEPMAHSSGCAYGGSGAGPLSLFLALAVTGLVATRARRRDGNR